MNRTFTSFFLVAGLFCAAGLSAQELTGTAAAQRIAGAARIRLDADGTTPAFIAFDPSADIDAANTTDLQRRIFGNRPDDSWKPIRTENDAIGMTHARYQQQYKQLDVEGQVYIFHAKEGKLVSANGHYLANISLSTEAAITSEQALVFAAAGMTQPFSLENADRATAQLVVLPLERKPVLAYKCELLSHRPLVNKIVYVDAQTGSVLREVSRLCGTDTPGTAQTHFSGAQPIVADQVGNGYLLRESGRGNGIETYESGNQQLYFDTDNNWNNVNGSMDQFAGDVHFGAEATYDFFYEHFGRDSYDNNGGLIRSYVNDETVGVNAYWSGGGDNTMHYGNGDNNYFPVASLEIAGHELSHGVTEYSAGLEYWGESGALNESFSDIFGSTIRFQEVPSVATWYIGDQLLRPGGFGDLAFRNMSDPNEFLNPDTYGGLYFNTGDIVHYDSGIQNFWYYLLVEGGSGTNDIGNAYSVSGIGMEDAVQIAYRNLAYYLTPSSTFLDARYGAEQAATDLFGLCSDEHLQTIHAWYAVGVGENETAFQPVAAFTVSNDFSCEAPLATQFFAEGDYYSYYWDFGDGDTSSLQTPTHMYGSTGYYTVTLIVLNNTSCQQPDTLVVPNAIVIDTIAPAADFAASGTVVVATPFTFSDQSLYGPVSWEWDFGDGTTSTLQDPVHIYADTGTYTVQLIVHNCHGSDTITQLVEVGNFFTMCEDEWLDSPAGVIYDPGGPNADYPAADAVCILRIRPCNASTITLTFEEFDVHPLDAFIILDGGSMIEYYTGNTLPPVLTTNTGRFEIHFFTDLASDGAPGFRISYASALDAIPDTESADYYSFPPMSAVGQSVSFNDQSEYYPVSWLWTFGDGATSTEQHPDHAYASPGTYNVTLAVTYCNGYVDMITRSHYVYDSGVGVEELSAGNLLNVYPNPSNGVFTLSAGIAVGNAELRVLDMSGREVYRHAVTEIAAEGFAIDAGRLGNGHYLLETLYEYNGVMTLERHKIQVMR